MLELVAEAVVVHQHFLSFVVGEFVLHHDWRAANALLCAFLNVVCEDKSHWLLVQHGLQSLKTEFVKVEVNVHDLDLLRRAGQVFLLEHLLRLDQTSETKPDFLFRHAHPLEQGFSEDTHCVRLQHLLQCARIFHLRLGYGISEVRAVELPQISEEVFVNDFITYDRPGFQVVEFELGSVLVQSPF